jgi:hypothetical protein
MHISNTPRTPSPNKPPQNNASPLGSMQKHLTRCHTFLAQIEVHREGRRSIARLSIFHFGRYRVFSPFYPQFLSSV